MKKIILVLSLLCGTLAAKAQNNPNANPLVWGINAAVSPIQVGATTTTTFSVGNNGADPIPAGGATFSVSFPPNVLVNQATLNMNGGDAIFAATWNVLPNIGTFLTINVIGSGIPAATFMGPQVRFDMTVTITGAVAGGPQQQTLNAANDAGVAQNLNAGDDNANGPIQVTAALPITLQSFTGKLADRSSARLDWKISDALQFSHFELERSQDGLNFNKIATVAYTNKQDYTSYDKTISSLNDKVYYRLKMVDNDGSSKLSNIVILRLNTVQQDISLFPNPATQEVKVSGISEKAVLDIYSLDGRLLLQKALSATQATIDISTLPIGIYTVKITDNNSTKTVKLIKE